MEINNEVTNSAATDRITPRVAAIGTSVTAAPAPSPSSQQIAPVSMPGKIDFASRLYTSVVVTAPMMFLILWKQSLAPCAPAALALDPERFVHTQVDLVLQGLLSGKTGP